MQLLCMKRYNLSPNLVAILSFDNIFLECDFAQRMIFRGKRNRPIDNFTINVNPGYKHIEKFHGGVQWYMMQCKDFFSSISFGLKKANSILVSFNDQSITLRNFNFFSIKTKDNNKITCNS